MSGVNIELSGVLTWPRPAPGRTVSGSTAGCVYSLGLGLLLVAQCLVVLLDVFQLFLAAAILGVDLLHELGQFLVVVVAQLRPQRLRRFRRCEQIESACQ